MKIDDDANVKNWLIQDMLGILYVIKDMIRILVNDVGKYLDYEKCKCRKWQVDKLVDECTENIDEVKILDNNESKCNS